MRIKDETRQRVLEAARVLDYHPDATARRMVSGRTRVVGFVLPQTPDEAFADRFLPQVLNGLTQATMEKGYHLLLEPRPPSPDGRDGYLRLIQERQVDGIVLSGPRSSDPGLHQLHARGTPIVLMGKLPDSGIASVDVDNVGGAEMAVQHLLGLGHRQIGMITNAPVDYTGSADRLAGYRRALQEASIEFDERLIRTGNFTPQSGFAAMRSLLEIASPPSAVFAGSDTVALGAYQAIRERGLRIPEDVSVIGFDDVPSAEAIEPPLTTVRLPAYAIGWAAVELVIQLIENPSEVTETRIELETELVVRRSTGPAPG